MSGGRYFQSFEDKGLEVHDVPWCGAVPRAFEPLVGIWKAEITFHLAEPHRPP